MRKIKIRSFSRSHLWYADKLGEVFDIKAEGKDYFDVERNSKINRVRKEDAEVFFLVNIELTQKHIDAGKPYCVSICPVALAIQEQMNTESVIVDVRGIMFVINSIRYRAITPKIVADFIDLFDHWAYKKELHRGNIKPFSFELEYYQYGEIINAF